MIPVVSRIVEVCVFRFVRSTAEYLILQRASEEELYPDLWQIVTGEVNEDETAVEAALRELREETGCAPVRMWSVPETTTFFDARRNEMNLCPVFCVQVPPDAHVQTSVEHRQYQWLSRSGAMRRLVWPSHRKVVQVVDEYIVNGQEAADCLAVDILDPHKLSP
jgi:dihydroneopterin triphosphate diphosphatase